MKAYLRAIAAWCSGPTLAQSFSGVTILALTLYTGYNIPEPSMIGALRWITYINVRIYYLVHYLVRLTVGLFFQPLKYAYESIMANEFRTLDLECSNLVPQGPGYENITLTNQVCAVVGAIPGQTTVNGLRYLKLSFNYEWSRVWGVRNCFVPIVSSFPRSHILFPRISAS
jgi:ATP-binding cassette subfamily G (WHITE) protein 2 (SNQ2)